MSLRTTTLVAAFVLLSAVTLTGIAQTAPGVGLFLPSAPGETWYVCQGYFGTLSHHNRYAFDLTVESSMGPGGCYGDQHAAEGHAVLAPAAGTVTRIIRPKVEGDEPFDEAKDMICLDLDVGGSLVIGQMTTESLDMLEDGTHVEALTKLGDVAPASPNAGDGDFIGNGDYAHIHIEARSDDACEKNAIYY